MIFKGRNRVQMNYGVFDFKRSNGSTHRGLDIDTPDDPTIHATVAGRVKYARKVEKGATGWGSTWEWGWFIWIVANDGLDHIYAHCEANSLRVKEGQAVASGAPIATMGNTGNAALNSPPYKHVHYEVRANGKAVNPAQYAGIPNAVGVYSSNQREVQSMRVVDVYADITAAQTGARAFNVQTFGSPNVADVAGNNLPDGRYWCNESGVAMVGLTGYCGAKIMVDGKAVYVAIIPGATEYTEMTNEEACRRFVGAAKTGGYTEAEGAAMKAQLSASEESLRATQSALTAAQSKIENAQRALS